MSEPEPPGASKIDVEMMRQIDAVCRRFEAEYRAGNSPVIADYLGEVREAGRSALKSELIAMLRVTGNINAGPEVTVSVVVVRSGTGRSGGPEAVI